MTTCLEEDGLTAKQRKVLRLIYEYPDMSQGDLAQHEELAQSMVSSRLNTIDGFSWRDRQQFVSKTFEDESTDDTDEKTDQASNSRLRNGKSPTEIEGVNHRVIQQLHQRISDLEQQVKTGDGQATSAQINLNSYIKLYIYIYLSRIQADHKRGRENY